VGLLMQQVAGLKPYSKWQCAPLEAGKAPNGYVGLRNLGNTCYMNATLQQLYNIPKLRYGILSIQNSAKGEGNANSVLQELWNMFSWLDFSNRQAYDPYGFCQAYKHVGRPVDVLVQMDASEFFTSLCEQIDEELKGSAHKELLDRLFCGKLCQQLVCLGGCGRTNARDEPFYVLPLDVKNHRSLHEACEAYVQGEVLEDFKCEQCNKQVKTRKRAALQSMCNTLIISLKRFEFDYDTFTRRKLNDYFEFPEQFDAWPYSVEGLKQSDLPEHTQQERDYNEHPHEYYKYVLRGVVVHMGSAETGHYYSFIREREPRCDGKSCRWLRFDDASVTEFDMGNNLEEECFGGEYTERVWDKVTGHVQGRRVMRTRNAYMLVYERETVIEESTGEGGKDEGWYGRMMSAIPDQLATSVVSRLNWLTRSGTPASNSSADSHLFDHVLEDNLAFMHDQQIIDSSYLAFIESILCALPLEEHMCADWDAGPNAPGLVALQAVTSFTLEVTAHARDQTTLPSVIQRLKVLFNRCLPACRWMLESITVEGRWLRKLLLECPIESTRLLFLDLLVSVLVNVNQCESLNVNRSCPNAQSDDQVMDEDGGSNKKLLTFMLAQRMLGLLDEACQFWRNFAQFFLLFHYIAMLGPRHQAFLLDNNLKHKIALLLKARPDLECTVMKLLGPAASAGPQDYSFPVQNKV